MIIFNERIRQKICFKALIYSKRVSKWPLKYRLLIFNVLICKQENSRLLIFRTKFLQNINVQKCKVAKLHIFLKSNCRVVEVRKEGQNLIWFLWKHATSSTPSEVSRNWSVRELHASQKSLKINHSHAEVSTLSSVLRVHDHGIVVLKYTVQE